jgi:outer membrane protein TolC
MRFVIWVLGALIGAQPVTSSILAQEPSDQRSMVRIGIVLDGPWEEYDRIVGLFEREITDLLRSEFDVRFPATARRTANWTARGVRDVISLSLADPELDVLIALGPISSHVVGGRTNLSKPTIAAFVVDAELQGLPSDGGASGVPNLSYVSIPSAINRDLIAFREITSFSRVALLINAGLLDAIPGLTAGAREAATMLGVQLDIVAATQSAANVLTAISSGVDAVYVTPLTNLPRSEWDQLVAGVNARRLPSFSYLGAAEVEGGILASLNPNTFFPRLARRVALNIQRILLGESPGALPVAFTREEQLTINMATARQVGVYPSWTVLTDAVLLNAESVIGARQVTLAGVAREAVLRNLDLIAEERFVAAGSQDVKLARSQWLPQIEVSGQTTIIDEDRAAASLGSQAQRSFNAGGTVTQLLFSEPAAANVRIQGGLQDAREHGRAGLELDIVLEAVTAYLNVLRATTVVRVQQENLRVTRSNLELARVRRSIGTAGPGEVYRWESELATGRQAVIAAQQDVRIAEIALNRVLNQPLEEPLILEDVRVEDPPLLSSDERLLLAVDNPQRFELFRQFMVIEGLGASPELRQLDAAIGVQRRVLSSTTNTFWSPTVALQGSLTNLMAEGGAGAGDFQIPDVPPGSFPPFPQSNDLSWSLGLRISLPLFEGGGRFAERARASEELAQLTVERDAVAERVQQRILTALQQAGSSHPSIRLFSDAADAAGRNLELVTDAYSRGVTTVIDLLDAQNAALVADLRAANAVYDFLVDMMAVERAIGRFDFFMTDGDREAFYERLVQFFANAGISLSAR